MVETNFKHTEIGLIPHDWEVATLGELVNVHDGTHQTPHYVNVGVNFYSVENITNNEFSKTKFISEEEHALLTRKFKIERGDVLMTRIGSIGVCKYIDWDVRASFYVSLALLKNKDKDRLYMPFLAFASTTKEFKDSVSQNSLQFAIPLKINLGKISDITFPLPPTLAEQERIAGALSSIDTLIGALNEQIEKKRHIKQGTMQQLLTGKKRLAGFTGEWKEVRLGDVAKLKSGYAFKSTTYSNIGTFKIITIANVQNGVLDMSDYNKIAEIPSNIQEHQILKEGDILVSMTGNVGRVCRVDCENCLLNQRVGVFALKNTIDAEYLYVILNSLEFEKEMIGKGHGAAQPNIGSSDVESYCFVVPPTIAEQSAIAAVLSGMDTEIAALEQKRDKYIAIKSGMMQDLLTGKIRLV